MAPQPAEYALLMPGDSLEADVDVSRFYSFGHSGQHEIKVNAFVR
jgi:hypothetical protein